MCQLSKGAMFKHKREVVKNIKTTLDLIRAYKDLSCGVKKIFHTQTARVVLLRIRSERVGGYKRLAKLIKRRAIRAGLLV